MPLDQPMRLSAEIFHAKYDSCSGPADVMAKTWASVSQLPFTVAPCIAKTPS